MEILVNGFPKVLDGTPTSFSDTDFTKWARSNEYIWDKTINNAKVVKVNDIYSLVATRSIPARTEVTWCYDDEYDWSEVILDSNIPTLLDNLRWVCKHVNNNHFDSHIQELQCKAELLTAADVRNSNTCTDPAMVLLLMGATGNIPIAHRHFFIPRLTSDWISWLELTICSEIVYRNSAFRHAHNPAGCPLLKLLLEDKSTVTTGGTRQSSPRRCKPVITRPSDEQCTLGGPYTYVEALWQPSLVSTMRHSPASPVSPPREPVSSTESTSEAGRELAVSPADPALETSGLLPLPAQHYPSGCDPSECTPDRTATPQHLLDHTTLLSKEANIRAPGRSSKFDSGKNLRTYIHNVDTLTEAKLADILELLVRERIDVCILLDTGTLIHHVESKTRDIKHRLQGGYGVHIFPTVRLHTNTSVGGGNCHRPQSGEIEESQSARPVRNVD